MQTQTWILASQSPRRAQLLSEAQIDFEPIKPPFEDPQHPQDTGESAEDIAIQLSHKKALSVQKNYPIRPIIAADTLIIQPDGKLAGTPTCITEAKTIIQQMINQTHWVVTGVTLLQPLPHNNIFFADRAEVILGNIPDSELQAYLNTGLWQGKAGGYNLFERQKANWPITVKGDPTTVVGLPMKRLLQYLLPNP